MQCYLDSSLWGGRKEGSLLGLGDRGASLLYLIRLLALNQHSCEATGEFITGASFLSVQKSLRKLNFMGCV